MIPFFAQAALRIHAKYSSHALLKFTIVLLSCDAGFELTLVMLLVFMSKEQSHNFYTLFCILEILLNPGYYPDF